MLLKRLCGWNFLKNVYFWERDRQSMTRGGAEREGDIESEAGSRLWTSCQHRVWRGAWTHEPQNHDQSGSRALNQLSHPRAPRPLVFLMAGHIAAWCLRGTPISERPSVKEGRRTEPSFHLGDPWYHPYLNLPPQNYILFVSQSSSHEAVRHFINKMFSWVMFCLVHDVGQFTQEAQTLSWLVQLPPTLQ